MEIGEWLEQLSYEGDSLGKSGKSVWVVMKGGGKLGDCLFSIPISLMIPYSDGKVYRIVQYKDKRFIRYQMTKGAHNSCTWGKKKEDGTRMFKSSKVWGTTSVQQTAKKGGLTRSDKMYYCKACAKKVYIERDDNSNAYCTDCGVKMFG